MSLLVLFSERQSWDSWNEFVHFPWKWTLSHDQIMSSQVILLWVVTIAKGLLNNMVERKINVLQ